MDAMQTTSFLRLIASFRKLEVAIHDLQNETVQFIDNLEKNKEFLNNNPEVTSDGTGK